MILFGSMALCSGPNAEKLAESGVYDLFCGDSRGSEFFN
jgi:hypothetical protein